jgi:hypothetical protein
MVSTLSLNAIDFGFKPRSGETKDYKLVFAASALSMQLEGVRAITNGIRIMCLSRAT